MKQPPCPIPVRKTKSLDIPEQAMIKLSIPYLIEKIIHLIVVLQAYKKEFDADSETGNRIMDLTIEARSLNNRPKELEIFVIETDLRNRWEETNV